MSDNQERANQVAAGNQVRAFIERAERLNDEAKSIRDDLKELFAEAKGEGFNVPVLKKIIKDRAKDPSEMSEFEAIEALYVAALQGSLQFEEAA